MLTETETSGNKVVLLHFKITSDITSNTVSMCTLLTEGLILLLTEIQLFSASDTNNECLYH